MFYDDSLNKIIATKNAINCGSGVTGFEFANQGRYFFVIKKLFIIVLQKLEIQKEN